MVAPTTITNCQAWDQGKIPHYIQWGRSYPAVDVNRLVMIMMNMICLIDFRYLPELNSKQTQRNRRIKGSNDDETTKFLTLLLFYSDEQLLGNSDRAVI